MKANNYCFPMLMTHNNENPLATGYVCFGLNRISASKRITTTCRPTIVAKTP